MPFLRGELTAPFYQFWHLLWTHDEIIYETETSWGIDSCAFRVMALDLDAIIIAAYHLESKALSCLSVVEIRHIRLSWMSMHRLCRFRKVFPQLRLIQCSNCRWVFGRLSTVHWSVCREIKHQASSASLRLAQDSAASDAEHVPQHQSTSTATDDATKCGTTTTQSTTG